MIHDDHPQLNEQILSTVRIGVAGDA